MKLDSILKGRRLSLLLKNEVLRGWKGALVALGAVFGTLLIIYLSLISGANYWSFHSVFFPLTLFIGGLIATSLIFSDLHNKQKCYTYLTLPASVFEKFLAKLFYSTVGFVLAIIIGYFLFSLLAAGVTSFFWGKSYQLFNPFTRDVWRNVGLYCVIQSIFLFGAVYFKKQTMVKTVLTINGLALGFAIFASLVFGLLFWNMFHGFAYLSESSFDLFRFNFSESKGVINFYVTCFSVLKVMFLYVMPPFFWILTFLRLKEVEVK